jgi:DNA damage-binding protein 1
MPFSKFRAFKSTVRESEEAFRFVDGEALERFLDCSPEVQQEIVGLVGGDETVERVRCMIEGLRRLH